MNLNVIERYMFVLSPRLSLSKASWRICVNKALQVAVSLCKLFVFTCQFNRYTIGLPQLIYLTHNTLPIVFVRDLYCNRVNFPQFFHILSRIRTKPQTRSKFVCFRSQQKCSLQQFLHYFNHVRNLFEFLIYCVWNVILLNAPYRL